MIYVYNCSGCGEFEFKQSIHDDALTYCPECGNSIYRVIYPTEVLWKGRFRWMKGNPEVDMDKIEASERKAEAKIIDGKIYEGLKEVGKKRVW